MAKTASAKVTSNDEHDEALEKLEKARFQAVRPFPPSFFLLFLSSVPFFPFATHPSHPRREARECSLRLFRRRRPTSSLSTYPSTHLSAYPPTRLPFHTRPSGVGASNAHPNALLVPHPTHNSELSSQLLCHPSSAVRRISPVCTPPLCPPPVCILHRPTPPSHSSSNRRCCCVHATHVLYPRVARPRSATGSSSRSARKSSRCSASSVLAWALNDILLIPGLAWPG